MLKPDPVTAALEITTSDPPEFVIVADCEPLLEVCTLPKLKLEGVDVSSPVAAAFPENATVTDGLEALLVIIRAPVFAPAASGAYFTVKLVLCPAASVKGRLGPLTLNPVPLAFACEIVTLVPPVFVTVSVRICVLPICVELNARLEEESDNTPAAAPVPESAMFAIPFAALLLIANVPDADPAATGANITLKLALCPGANVIGVVRPLAWNPAPVTVA